MALLSYEQEMVRAKPERAFANGFEADSWMSIWCNDCVREATCPLIMVALMDHTPDAWDDVRPGYLNRYHCREFESTTSKENDK